MSRAVPRHMPQRRTGHTTAVTIAGERFYLTANGRGDDTLGEVFIRWGKQGQTQAGLMDVYAVTLSVALQHGVPLRELVRQGLGLWFVPNGSTSDPDIPRVRSVVDWVVRRLALDWLPDEERAELGIYSMREREDAAAGWMAHQDAALTRPSLDGPPEFLHDVATGIGAALR